MTEKGGSRLETLTPMLPDLNDFIKVHTTASNLKASQSCIKRWTNCVRCTNRANYYNHVTKGKQGNGTIACFEVFLQRELSRLVDGYYKMPHRKQPTPYHADQTPKKGRSQRTKAVGETKIAISLHAQRGPQHASQRLHLSLPLPVASPLSCSYIISGRQGRTDTQKHNTRPKKRKLRRKKEKQEIHYIDLIPPVHPLR